MRCQWWLLVLFPSVAWGQTLPATLLQGFSCVGLQPNPAFRTFAAQLTRQLGEASNVDAGAAPTFGAIDSTLSLLGPIVLANSDTLGARSWNLNSIVQHGVNEHPFQGPLLLADTRVGTPQQEEPVPAVFPANLLYTLKVRTTIAVVAASYGVTDHFDVSLVVPIIHETAEVQASLTIPGVGTRSGTRRAAFTGIGDIGLRSKYGWRWGQSKLSMDLRLTLPSGDDSQGLGTGDVFLTPVLTWTYPFGRGEVTANVGFNIDTNQVRESSATYGLGASVVAIPRRLAGIVEMLGTSELTDGAVPLDTGILFLAPSGEISQENLFGFDFQRHDFLDLVFGLRIRLTEHITGFLVGVYALNEVGIRDNRITPTVGLGARF